MSTVTLPNIALVGKAGAGKSTIAKMLEDNFQYTRLSFAAPLKVMCGPDATREQLQRVGLGVRELEPLGWVRLLLDEKARHIEAVAPNPDNYGRATVAEPRFVVDDCRFPNEVDALKAEGFVVVRVAADHATRVARLRANGKLGDESELFHPSELTLDYYTADYRIANYEHTTQTYLAEQVAHILTLEQR